MSWQSLALPVAIFLLRVFNYSLSTVRVVAITRQKRVLASAMAFVEALVFALVIANVVNDLSNLPNLFAYCLGASFGSYAGMLIEARFITSYRTVNVITHERGHEIAVALRAAGYGVTETVGEGRDGVVTMIRSVILQRDVPQLLKIVRDVYANAFISVEEAHGVQRGWVRFRR